MGAIHGYIMDMVKDQVVQIKYMWKNKRMLTFQALNLAMIIFSALILWKGLQVYTDSESPVVVVLSGSMEPAVQRGDILVLDNSHETAIRVGEIVVFKIKGRDIPIVHRVLQVRDNYEGKIKMLTKGDNNQVDDRGLYAHGQLWLEREDILGRAKIVLPYAGMVTIILNDYPYFKYVLIGVMAYMVLTNKE
mmetsp:Transcript_20910/g.25365  ORF Transcript_20910/g.25365 Transcript_20910/m.25365 type:complete len:191 (-) Transcript_20910:1223-1795(-)|eukprot:CAMPEP_0204822586 /NCGR_PEP_ID=MMETSP1346-20131115/775_1 /ASSEMBLY_ACC=CAM_ASM_000771 /TAXON_ID=215587 /ORGANISM="Aplanochytrium stocchinoi, Strain GSBS06" /LENGTH=190 /DNA_ID=CAMNT_0051948871 /DNA_START=45 /DNA_END=617 /DNA_ORIENTATION=-